LEIVHRRALLDNGLHNGTNNEPSFTIPVFARDVHVIESHLDPFAVFISEHPSKRRYRARDSWLCFARFQALLDSIVSV
jgi:hypothetical protein